MNAALWADVVAEVAAAETHFCAADRLAQAEDLRSADFEGYRAQMALMHALQSGHTAAEAALRRILAILDEPLPAGADWHGDLIARLARPIDGQRPAALPPALADALQETRRFRHVAMHLYDHFDPDRALAAVAAGAVVAAELRPALTAFRERLTR